MSKVAQILECYREKEVGTFISCSVYVKNGKTMKRQDLGIVYRILVCIREGNNNVSKIVKCSGASPSTVLKYLEVMKSKGLITERTNKERIFHTTRKGEDFIFLFSRLLALWGE